MHRMNNGNRNSAVTALSPEKAPRIASSFWACFSSSVSESLGGNFAVPLVVLKPRLVRVANLWVSVPLPQELQQAEPLELQAAGPLEPAGN